MFNYLLVVTVLKYKLNKEKCCEYLIHSKYTIMLEYEMKMTIRKKEIN